MTRLWPMWLLCGCASNPVDDCDSFPASDCCETNEQCFEFYGSEFPICAGPGRPKGGTCSACATDRHCSDGETCETAEHGQGVCVAL